MEEFAVNEPVRRAPGGTTGLAPVLVIAGANCPLGSAVASRFRKEGWRVLVVDRDRPAIAIDEQIGAAGPPVVSFAANISTQSGVESAALIAEELGGSVALIHISPETCPAADVWERGFLAAVRIARALHSQMLRQPTGQVVFVGPGLSVENDPVRELGQAAFAALATFADRVNAVSARRTKVKFSVIRTGARAHDARQVSSCAEAILRQLSRTHLAFVRCADREASNMLAI
jgi:NADP-dependent 3-hydroxy acid dehydrogenase YdfG